MALKHSVYDTDTHFSINPITRALMNESSGKNTMIQYDHNSERITFEIPRFIEGHDMTKCDVIQVHYNNINSSTKEQNCGVYEVDDMQISPEDENIVILSWLISGNATKYVGSLNFLIRFACANDDGTLSYVWNTAVYSGISISSGIYNGDVVAEEYADILAQWEKELMNAGGEGVNIVQVAQNKALSEIDREKQAALLEIDNRDRTLFANAIKGTAKGSKISITDISPLKHILDLKAFSENYVKYPFYNTTKTMNGATFTDVGNGTVSVTGAGTTGAYFTFIHESDNCILPAGKYCFKALASNDGATNKYYAYVTVYLKTGKVNFQDYGQGVKFELEEDTQVTCSCVVQTAWDGTEVVFAPQINKSEAFMPYTPYVDITTIEVLVNEKTYSVDADGTVVGVESEYPALNISSSVAGVYFELTYNQDVQKCIDQKIIDSQAGDGVPEYFESVLETAIASAKSNMIEAGVDGETFIWISDLHWNENRKNSPSLIKRITKAIPTIRNVVMTGDFVGNGAYADILADMQDCADKFRDCADNLLCLFGNHDDNVYVADARFLNNEFYTVMQKQADYSMKYGNPYYFYFDNPTTKTRYICLDSMKDSNTVASIPEPQKAWFENVLVSTEDDWRILVFSHIVFNTTQWTKPLPVGNLQMTVFMQSVCNICDTHNSTKQAKICGIFGGHVHLDHNSTTNGGIPIMMIDTDAQTTYSDRLVDTGTETEQCFDIVTVDYVNRTIKCVRVGRGTDRTFTF